MSRELKKYKARIFGELYSIVSNEDEAMVLDVVQKVDLLMKEIATKHNMAIDTKKIAVLAALKITEELVEMQQALHNEQLQTEKIMTLLSEDTLSL